MCKLGVFEPEIIELHTQYDQRREQIISSILFSLKESMISDTKIYQIYITQKVYNKKKLYKEESMKAELSLGIFSS